MILESGSHGMPPMPWALSIARPKRPTAPNPCRGYQFLSPQFAKISAGWVSACFFKIEQMTGRLRPSPQELVDFSDIIFFPVFKRVGGLRMQQCPLGIQDKKLRI